VPAWRYRQEIDDDERVLVSHAWNEIRALMWNYVGIVRSELRLSRAWQRIRLINREIHDDYWQVRPHRDLIELRNLGQVAEIIIASARFRKESRGLHTMLNYPEKRREFVGATEFRPFTGETVLAPISLPPDSSD